MADLTTAAVGIKDVYAPTVFDGVFRNEEFLAHFPVEYTQGDDTIKWIVNSAGGTTGTYAEGDSPIAASSQAYVSAILSPTYIEHRFVVTGHLMDAMRSGNFDILEFEMSKAIEDMKDYLNTAFLGASNSGLEVAVDAGSTYAGIARGAAAYWESTETAVGGALAYNDMTDVLETIKDNDKGGKTGKIFAPYNQLTNLYNLSGMPGTKFIGPADAAPGLTQQTFNGIPVFGIPDMTDTVIVFLDDRAGKNALMVHRPLNVVELGKTKDQDDYLLTMSAALVNRMPKYDGKLTGVTA